MDEWIVVRGGRERYMVGWIKVAEMIKDKWRTTRIKCGTWKLIKQTLMEDYLPNGLNKVDITVPPIFILFIKTTIALHRGTEAENKANGKLSSELLLSTAAGGC